MSPDEKSDSLINAQALSWFNAFETCLNGKLDSSKNVLDKLIDENEADLLCKLDRVGQNFKLLSYNLSLVVNCELKLSGITYYL